MHQLINRLVEFFDLGGILSYHGVVRSVGALLTLPVTYDCGIVTEVQLLGRGLANDDLQGVVVIEKVEVPEERFLGFAGKLVGAHVASVLVRILVLLLLCDEGLGVFMFRLHFLEHRVILIREPLGI